MGSKKQGKLLKQLYTYIQIYNIWPLENDTNWSFYGRLFVLIGGILYYDFGIIMYLITTSMDDRALFAELIDGLYTVQCAANLQFNYFGMVYIHERTMRLFKELQNFDNFGVPKQLARTARKVTYVNRGLFTYCAGGPFGVCVFNFVVRQACLAKNEKTGREETCGYTTFTVYPYSIAASPFFEIHLFITTFYVVYMCGGGTTFACACYTAVEYINVRIEHLKSMLRKLSQVKSHQRDEDFRFCVRYHQYIISLTEQTNKCFSIILTPALFLYSVNIGLSLFHFLLDHSCKGLFNCIGWLSLTAVVCIIGDELIDKSMSLAFEAYGTNWYSFDIRLKKDTMFMIRRAQEPLTLRVGSFGHLSLPLLKQILSGAYTYVTMRNMAND